MKITITLLSLAVLLFLVSPTYAADVKLSGDIRLRSIWTDNLGDADDTKDDRQTFSDGRFRIKTAVSSERVTGVVTLDIVNDFNDPKGCPSEAGADANPLTGAAGATSTAFSADGCGTGHYRMGTVAFGNSYNIVGVREAYLLVKFDPVKFALGRKPFKLGQGLLLEDTVDGIAAKVQTGPVETVIASIKLVERSGVGTAKDDSDLYLLKFRLVNESNKTDMYKGNSLFVSYLKDRQPFLIPFASPLPGVVPPLATDEAALLAGGVMVDLPVGPDVVINFEADYLTGELKNTASPNNDLAGFNLLLGADLKTLLGNIVLTALYTTGDESAADNEVNINGISGNFVLGNILINDNINSDRDGQCSSLGGTNGTGRIMFGGRGCIGGAGITALKAKFPTSGRIPTEFVLIWAQTTEPVSAGGSKDLGLEIDFNQKYRLDENAFIGVNLGYLVSGDAYKNVGSGTDGQMKVVAALNYTF